VSVSSCSDDGRLFQALGSVDRHPCLRIELHGQLRQRKLLTRIVWLHNNTNVWCSLTLLLIYHELSSANIQGHTDLNKHDS